MAKAEIEYMAAGPESLDDIRELWEKLNLLHSNLSLYFGDLARLRTFEARKNELLEKSMSGFLRLDLAKDALTGQVIGYIVSTLSLDGYGEIDSIFVEKDYRGKDIGEKLMNRTLAWLDESNARMKSIAVAAGNELAFGFYQRFGFYPITTTLMQGEIIVRRATASDIDEIHKMHISSIRELCQSHYTPAQIETWTATLQSESYLQAIEALDFRVAQYSDGRLAGIIIVDANCGVVRALYVAPFAAGKGLGKRLLCLAEGVILANGKREATLKATLNAEAFYRHHGWNREGCSAHCLGDERALPCALMRKQIS